MKHILNWFKPKYRLIQLNGYWKYMVQKKSWYNSCWQDVKGSDSLQIAKENFKLIVHGPLVIETSFNERDEDEVY